MSVFGKTLQTVSLLMDGGIPAFINTLFLQKKFPISSCKRFVCHNIFLFCGTDSFGGLLSDYTFVTTVSNILFHMPADGFVFGQCDLIFDISE